MIIKISTGGNHARSLVSYMAGPGNHHEHENQRTIAGGTVHYNGPLNKATVKQVVSDLQAYQNLYPDVTVSGGSVWQCSLAVAPEEGPVSDQTWGAISTDLMQGLGFVGPGRPDVRWAIFGHGDSVNGNPHCHIVMNRVRSDGRKVNTYRDMVKAQAMAPQLEAKYGLKVLASRVAAVGAGSVPYTQAEAVIAKQQNRAEPDRVALERKVRAIATTAASEAEFVRTARAKGLVIRPFPATETAKVTGYSIGIRAKRGERQAYFSGGQLARDLTLPQLRRGWDPTPEQAAAAQRAWRGTSAVKAEKPGPALKPVLTAKAEIIAAQTEFEAITPEQLADFSHDLAGTLAAASEATETTPGPLAKASRDVGAWAQPSNLASRTQKYRQHTKSAALMFAIAMDPQSSKSQMLVAQQLADMVATLYRLHLASRQMANRERSTTMSTQPADGLDDFVHDGLTMATVAGSRLAEVHALHKHQETQQGEQSISPKEWEGMDDKQRLSIPEQVPSRRDQDELWDRNTIRRDRILAKQAEQRQKLDAFPRATAEQQQKLVDLSSRLGLVGMEHAVGGITEEAARKVLDSMEVAAEGLGPARLSEIIREPGLHSKTGYAEVRTDEDATAFLDRLERSKALRQEQAAPPERTSHAPIMTGNKDPRLWASAGEPVTKDQHRSLLRKGFTAEEIGTLRKGAASYVIGHDGLGKGEARKAFERNQQAPIVAAPGSASAPNLSTSMTPPTDIRTRQRPPTQRQ